MKLCLYTNIVSPHQMPLARELVKLLGEKNFRYIYTDPFHAERFSLGWSDVNADAWCVRGCDETPDLEAADILFCGNRALSLFERRCLAGRRTFYFSERWFKPIWMPLWRRLGVLVSGKVRLIWPPYLRMVLRIIKLLKNDPGFYYYAMGVHAKEDMLWLCRLFGFDAREKIRLWGYFVAPSRYAALMHKRVLEKPIRLLWVGRMLRWKRVDTIIHLVSQLIVSGYFFHSDIELWLVGDGPEREFLRREAVGLPVKFIDAVPIDQIREFMRRSDVYVLASNEEEGWGAVLNEALEEGMRVIATYEAGSSATILPSKYLFHSGDTAGMIKCFQNAISNRPVGIGTWTAESASRRLLEDVMS